MNFSQVNFDAMTGSQLVDQYNEMAKTLGRIPVHKFESKRVAVARCETLRAIIDDEIVPDPPAKTMKAKSVVESPPKTTKAIVAELKERSVERNIEEKVTKAKAARPAPTKSEDRDAQTITVLTKDQANPRREGTDAHAHFERMRDRPTVAQYLGRFAADRRKVARHWLYNTVKDGFAEVK